MPPATDTPPDHAVSDRPGFDRDAVRTRIVDAALPHVPFDGWNAETLALAARDAGLDKVMALRVFPGGPVDAIRHWSELTDRRMVAACEEPGFAQKRTRDKVAHAVRVRLELVGAHREAVRRALAVLASPLAGGLSARLVWRTVDAIWYRAGDTASDFNYYTKRGLLAGVYGATVLTWLDDRSTGFADTWSFLDRRLDDALRIPRLMADATRWATPFVPGFLRPGRPAR
jgi:ubiquinone biosynthesis protein COQ9